MTPTEILAAIEGVEEQVEQKENETAKAANNVEEHLTRMKGLVHLKEGEGTSIPKVSDIEAYLKGLDRIIKTMDELSKRWDVSIRNARRGLEDEIKMVDALPFAKATVENKAARYERDGEIELSDGDPSRLGWKDATLSDIVTRLDKLVKRVNALWAGDLGTLGKELAQRLDTLKGATKGTREYKKLVLEIALRNRAFKRARGLSKVGTWGVNAVAIAVSKMEKHYTDGTDSA